MARLESQVAVTQYTWMTLSLDDYNLEVTGEAEV